MTARILVVDDVDANVRLLEAKLTAEYYDVLTATDGPSALAVAAREQPDIVLLDVMMPGMDGFEVCRRLKDDPTTRHIPVVLVTALDGHIAERASACRRLGKDRSVGTSPGRRIECVPGVTKSVETAHIRLIGTSRVADHHLIC